jgi:hypothetical protein
VKNPAWQAGFVILYDLISLIFNHRKWLSSNQGQTVKNRVSLSFKTASNADANNKGYNESAA